MSLQLLEGEAFNAISLILSLAGLGVGILQVVFAHRALRNTAGNRSRAPRKTALIRLSHARTWVPPRVRTTVVNAAQIMVVPLLFGLPFVPIAITSGRSPGAPCAANDVASPPSAMVSLEPARIVRRQPVNVTGHGFPPNSVLELNTRAASWRVASMAGIGSPAFVATDHSGQFQARLPAPEAMDTEMCLFVKVRSGNEYLSTTAVELPPA